MQAGKRRGIGLVVPAVTFACLALTQAASRLIAADPGYYSHHRWIQALAFYLSAAVIWKLGRRLNAGPMLHTLCFLPIEKWAYLLIAVGTGFFFFPI
jgi:hypothetical protein